jgi:hypothetical protein
MTEPIKYAIDPMSPFPKRWKDKLGNIRVITGPVEGYLMVRRPGAMPFVLHVAQMLNAETHPTHGPFEIVPPKRKNTTQEKT